MGTQFSKNSFIDSKTHKTSYWTPQGLIMNENDNNDDEDHYETQNIFTTRTHHSGVLSAHEILSYSLMGSSSCRPRHSIRRHLRHQVLSLRRQKTLEERGVKDSERKFLDFVNYSECSRPDSELDSGISVNVHYEREPRSTSLLETSENNNPNNEIEDDEEEDEENISKDFTPEIEDENEKEENDIENEFEIENLSQILKSYYKAHFRIWFSPSSLSFPTSSSSSSSSPSSSSSFSSSSSSSSCSSSLSSPPSPSSSTSLSNSNSKKLYQKLIASPGTFSSRHVSSAIQFDMDDRVKMLEYFSQKEKGYVTENSFGLEELFSETWSLPKSLPCLSTLITLQASAGIGKTSLLKYMLWKWGSQELWSSHFDIVIFIESRSLNRFGPLSSKDFLEKTLCAQDPSLKKYIARFEFDFWADLVLKASSGRLLILLDGLDEIRGVGKLHVPLRSESCKELLTPLEFAQSLLTGSFLKGAHVIVTSRPHTLSHLQSSKWFCSLQKKYLSLDILGLSDEGIKAFIHSYVDARDKTGKGSSSETWIEEQGSKDCGSQCECVSLQNMATSNPYIFSLASNPFYLWLLCSIFSQTGVEFLPKTLTQLYTWVMLLFSSRWSNTSLRLSSHLEETTLKFLLAFSQLCYHLVRSGNIKMSAKLINSTNSSTTFLEFPDFENVVIDAERAETFGLNTVSVKDSFLECEFRHLSLAEYLTALHVHISGASLRGFPKDRKELILQYLSGLSSKSSAKDQVVVGEFLRALGVSTSLKDPTSYLKIVQKMKGEWYNVQGLQKQLLFMRCAFESRETQLNLYPFPGLKIIHIRGSNLLSLDLIVINNFVLRLHDNNRLLELSLRDYPIDEKGLLRILPCLPLIRTVTLSASNLVFPSSYRQIAQTCVTETKNSRLRELWLLDIPYKSQIDDYSSPDDELGLSLKHLRDVCRAQSIKVNI